MAAKPDKASGPDSLRAHDKATLDREFSDFYRAHLRDIYNYTYYRTSNHHDAEDLTTQTFIQAYRHFERAKRESNGRPLRPWLVRIAHNLAANYYRDRARRPTSTLDVAELVASSGNTEDLVVGHEEATAVLRGVQSLPEERREALIMRFAMGMDNKEIASALGKTEGATKVLIHRAIKQLKQDLSKDGGENE
ncbi:MAG: sigma-70 family RNA polymerase sigma factor [Solirubrobacterales bacterium]